MAINLWKVGGLPTAYNPLATGQPANQMYTFSSGLKGIFTIRFKAKSATSATLRLNRNTNNTDIVLTPSYKSYEFTLDFMVESAPTLRLFDFGNGDIFINSIELVEKPLQKLTINGIDGFNSGKWTLHANATVIDDSTLELNATAIDQVSTMAVIPVKPSTTYIFTKEDDSKWQVDELNLSSTYIQTPFANTPRSFTFTTSANTFYLQFKTRNATTGTFTFKRPMLNLGSIPAPYEKKRGERMVLPVAKKNLIPFVEQGTVDGAYADVVSTTRVRTKELSIKQNSSYTVSSLGNNILCYVRYKNTSGGIVEASSGGFVSLPFTFSVVNGSTVKIIFKKADDSTILPSDINPQLEEGNVATPYKPYEVQLNDKPLRYVPKKNMVSNAQSDWEVGSGFATTSNGDVTRIRYKISINVVKGNAYTFSWNTALHDLFLFDDTLALTWYTSSPVTITNTNGNFRPVFRRKDGANVLVSAMDSINLQMESGTTATLYEAYQQVLPRSRTGLSFNGTSDYLQLPSMTMDSIEIDCLISSGQVNTKLIDARTGLLNGWINAHDTLNKGSGWVTVEGYKSGERTVIKATATNVFTDNVNILSGNLNDQFTKAILYKVTCYLVGSIVAQYDFENPSNTVGNTVIQNAKNLIPSFEDARWTLHANTQVLGKDVLRLNATGTFQASNFTLPCKPNSQYYFSCNNNGKINIANADTNTWISSTVGGVLTTPSDTTNLKIKLENTVAGTFDFIKPQLYALDGKEGTITGTPTLLNKQTKRSMYAKR